MVGAPFETISVDITGPFPKSSKGNVYMVTVMEHFTKWAKAIPLRNHTAPIVARALLVLQLTGISAPAPDRPRTGIRGTALPGTLPVRGSRQATYYCLPSCHQWHGGAISPHVELDAGKDSG